MTIAPQTRHSHFVCGNAHCHCSTCSFRRQQHIMKMRMHTTHKPAQTTLPKMIVFLTSSFSFCKNVVVVVLLVCTSSVMITGSDLLVTITVKVSRPSASSSAS